MKRKLLAALTAGALVSTSLTQVAMASTAPNTLTQDSAVKQLMSVFDQVPSWPKNLESWLMAPGITPGIWLDGKKSSYPPTQWIGLACVFPGDQPSQYTTDIGITETSPSGSVTASRLAQWIVDWEVKARHVDLNWQPSKDPYALLSLFSFFYGTNIKGPNSIVTQSDMYAIRNNIIEVSRGWRMLAANKVQMLSPLVATVDGPLGAFRFFVKIHQYKMSDWPTVDEAIIKTIDSQTFTAQSNGNIVYQYQRGTGLTPGIGGSFADGRSHVYSLYDWATNCIFSQPPHWDRIFNEPTPEVFNPNSNPASRTEDVLNFRPPSGKQRAFVSSTLAWTPFSAKMTQPLAFGLTFEFRYEGGKFDSINQVNTASYNYPAEVFSYD